MQLHILKICSIVKKHNPENKKKDHTDKCVEFSFRLAKRSLKTNTITQKHVQTAIKENIKEKRKKFQLKLKQVFLFQNKYKIENLAKDSDLL